MRTSLLPATLVLIVCAVLQANARAEDAFVATRLTMTVTSPDEAVVQSAAKTLADAHYTITMSTTRTDTPASTSWSVTGTRSGTFTEQQVRAHKALCTDHIVHGSASCKTEMMPKAP